MNEHYELVFRMWKMHIKELIELNDQILSYRTPDDLLLLSRNWSVESNVCKVLEIILNEMNPDFDVSHEMLNVMNQNKGDDNE